MPTVLTPTSTTNSKRLSGLALLRGIAALSVCLYHFSGEALPKLQVSSVRSLFSQGNMGVIIFFVISGFIIPYSLIGKEYSPRKFWPYISKRIVRINPPAYVAMLLVIMQWFIIDYFIAHQVKYTKDLTIGQIINNFFFTVPFSEYKWLIGIFWTLAIEFQFYIFVGLFFNIVYDKKNILWFVILFMVSDLMRYLPWQSSYNFFAFSSLFAIGGLLLHKKQGKLQPMIYRIALLLAGIIVYFEVGILEACVGVATALAIEYINFESSITRFIGNISYSLYLVHSTVGTTCEFVLTKIIPISSDLSKIIMLIICLLVSIAVAYLFYLFVEKPFMSIANKIKLG